MDYLTNVGNFWYRSFAASVAQPSTGDAAAMIAVKSHVNNQASEMLTTWTRSTAPWGTDRTFSFQQPYRPEQQGSLIKFINSVPFARMLIATLIEQPLNEF